MAVVVAAGLSAADRETLAGVWAFRARSEREASVRFGRLATRLEDLGAAPVLSRLARRAGQDEIRHTRICADLARGYGHPDRPEPAPTASPIGPARFDPRDRLLYEIVAFCCVTETLNASLMMVAYHRARNADVRGAIRALLRDEIAHSRLGWAHLEAERATGRGEFIAEWLPRMLAGTAKEDLFTPTLETSEPILAAHGELTQSARLELFLGTMDEVVFPGLERVGIDAGAGRGWIATHCVTQAARVSIAEEPNHAG